MTNPKEVLEHYRSEWETKVRKMEAGRDLDALVAEKVFNWTAWKEMQRDTTFIIFQKPEECEPYKKYRNWENEMGRFQKIRFSEIDYFNHIVMKIPEYSTDISSAWEVVKKMKNDNWCFILSDDLFNDKWTASFYWDPNQSMIDDRANTAPLAICKAALLAIWEDEQ